MASAAADVDILVLVANVQSILKTVLPKIKNLSAKMGLGVYENYLTSFLVVLCVQYDQFDTGDGNNRILHFELERPADVGNGDKDLVNLRDSIVALNEAYAKMSPSQLSQHGRIPEDAASFKIMLDSLISLVQLVE